MYASMLLSSVLFVVLALSINPGKKNISYMFTDKFIKEIKHLKTSITDHRLLQQKQRERKEKEN
ncbi:hypothetical protein ES703_100265 [subsurface metagenome]